ncbi:mediator of RNA polymerase II transcription subunit 31 isoform X3 [Musca domestica]|uniref:Mediator of RNA polymerase II transcription subunit 31 n=1 Tax=Musca domestica TaxID=7370 RepID=A0A1I8N4M2_MUSDO|nr:mediator of RNA polymerase II transcription subunit 31 isoform X3 [Musca domestica]
MNSYAATESEEQQKLRWQVELEFVQCLANPNYLNFLAQRGYFKDQAFINYLKYLQYWKEPEYAKYLMYPMCLYFLDLLQYEHFRREIVNSQCCKFIDDQAILQWQHYTRKRIKMLNAVNGNVNSQLNSTTGSNLDLMDGTQQQSGQLTGQQQATQQQGAQATNALGGSVAGNMQNGTVSSVGGGGGGGTTPQNQMVGQPGQQSQQQQLNGNSSNSSIVPNQSNTGAAMMQKI